MYANENCIPPGNSSLPRLCFAATSPSPFRVFRGSPSNSIPSQVLDLTFLTLFFRAGSAFGQTHSVYKKTHSTRDRQVNDHLSFGPDFHSSLSHHVTVTLSLLNVKKVKSSFVTHWLHAFARLCTLTRNFFRSPSHFVVRTSDTLSLHKNTLNSLPTRSAPITAKPILARYRVLSDNFQITRTRFYHPSTEPLTC